MYSFYQHKIDILFVAFNPGDRAGHKLVSKWCSVCTGTPFFLVQARRYDPACQCWIRCTSKAVKNEWNEVVESDTTRCRVGEKSHLVSALYPTIVGCLQILKLPVRTVLVVVSVCASVLSILQAWRGRESNWYHTTMWKVSSPCHGGRITCETWPQSQENRQIFWGTTRTVQKLITFFSNLFYTFGPF